jgi:hypothetical protein
MSPGFVPDAIQDHFAQLLQGGSIAQRSQDIDFFFAQQA